MIDGIFYFQGKTQEAEINIRPLFEHFGKLDMKFFTTLCETIIHELDTNLEESALSWREKRLAEKGFPSIREALGAYTFVNDRRIADLPKRDRKIKTETLSPKYPLMIGGDDLFF